MENEVEVVVNYIEPYKIKGETFALNLEEEFRIDMERDDILEAGLADARKFEVDSEKNIYFLETRGAKSFIFKFDRQGNFVTSFARKGQGPGELQSPRHLSIDSRDKLAITDSRRRRLVIYSRDGGLIKENAIDTNVRKISLLENGKYLVFKLIFDRYGDYLWQMPLSLRSFEWGEIKELGRLSFPNYLIGKRIEIPEHAFIWAASKENIYIGNEDRGYEIRVFNLEGNLVRKIKKEYRPVEIPEKLKEKYKQMLEDSSDEAFRRNTYIRNYMPPFQYFFTDEEGRLFVMTFENGENPGENMCDIYDHDGIFIGRKSLGNYYHQQDYREEEALEIRAINNLLYCLREKENGYKELVVYRMKWE